MQTTDRSCAAGDWSDVVPRRSAEQPVHDCALRAYPSGCSCGGLAGGSGRQLVEATLEQPHRLPAGGDGGGEGTLDPVDADEKALGGVGVDRQVANRRGVEPRTGERLVPFSNAASKGTRPRQSPRAAKV